MDAAAPPPLPASVLARFGLSLEQVEHARRTQTHGSASAAGTLGLDAADALDALRDKPLGEILVSLGHLDPQLRDEFDRTLSSPPHAGTLVPEDVAASDPAFRPRSLGKYELVGELGRGGMGRVYKAWHPGLKTHVALKVLLAGDHATEDQLQRFRREAEAAAKMHHPGILPVFDIGEDDGKTYIAMEYVDGVSLDQVLDHPLSHGLAPAGPAHLHRTGLKAADALRMTAEIADALQAAHEAGVVHRDLKPANVLRDAKGRLRVMDFGLARLVDAAGPGRTTEGSIMGTPEYMSPEQAEGKVDQVDAASDVYQIGAILYELLTGRPPYSGGAPMEIVLRVMREDPPPPRHWQPALDRDADTICRKALAREKAQRYASARALAEDCRRFLDREPILARPAAWWEKPVRWAKRRKALAGAATAAALALAVAAGAYWRAQAAERENARLADEVLSNLRTIATDDLDSALMIRRAGGKMPEVAARFLPSLQDAVNRAIERAPALAEPHFRLGRMYRALLRFADARSEQERALAKEPGYVPSLYERAILSTREYGERVLALRTAWIRTEGSRLAEAGAFERTEPGGARMKAMPTFAELAAGDPQAQKLRQSLRSDLQLLEAAPRAAGALMPAMLDCVRGLALVFAGEEKDRAEGAVFLQRTVEVDPTLEEAVEGLALYQIMSRALPDGIATLGRGIGADPGYVPYWLKRGDAELTCGQEADHRGQDPDEFYARAESDFGKALDLDPGATHAHLHRGLLREERGYVQARRGGDPAELYTSSIADFGKALELDPTLAEAWWRRGMVRTNWAVFRRERGEDPVELYRQAEADYDQALKLDPASCATWMHRGMVRSNWGLFQAERGEDPADLYAKADEDLGRALTLDPGSAETWWRRGNLRANWGLFLGDHGGDPTRHYQDAEGDFAKALELDPSDAEAHMRRGNLRSCWGSYRADRGEDPYPLYAQARADLDQSLKLDPASAEAWQHRASIELNWGRHRQAHGADPSELFGKAEEDYSQALKLNPASAETWAGRSLVRSNRGVFQASAGADPTEAYRGADADAGKAIELNPRSFKANLRRGRVRSNWGLFESTRGRDPLKLYGGAEADFGKALEIDPRSAEAWTGRGQLRRNWGFRQAEGGEDPSARYGSAEEDYGKALEIEPRSAESWKLRGCVRLNWAWYRQTHGADPTGLYRSALSDLDQSLALKADDAEGWISRGDLRMNWGAHVAGSGGEPGELYGKAAADYGKAQEINPRAATAWLRRGDLYMNWGLHLSDSDADPAELYEKATVDFGKALELTPGEAGPWTSRANVRGNLGYYRMQHGADPTAFYRDAEADFGKSLQINPGSAFTWLARGNLRENLGDYLKAGGKDPAETYGRAEADFNHALAIDPRNAQATWRRGRLHHAMGRWSDAVSDFEAGIKIDPSCARIIGAQLVEARARVRWAALMHTEAAWLDALGRGEAALQQGDHDAAEKACADSLATFEKGAAALSEADRAGLLADDSIRSLLVTAHYCCAAACAAQCGGRASADASARLKDLAFQHLNALAELGLTDSSPLRQDTNFASLQDDPRWAKLLGAMDGTKK